MIQVLILLAQTAAPAAPVATFNWQQALLAVLVPIALGVGVTLGAKLSRVAAERLKASGHPILAEGAGVLGDSALAILRQLQAHPQGGPELTAEIVQAVKDQLPHTEEAMTKLAYQALVSPLPTAVPSPTPDAKKPE